MKILLVGAGAVGLGVINAIIKSGEKPDILARNKTYELLNREGIYQKGIFGKFRIDREEYNLINGVEELKENYDLILIAVKTIASKLIVDNIKDKHILKDKGKIVLFHNGWGSNEEFEKIYSREDIYNARVITGFKRNKENEVEITVHADSVKIGSLYKYENDKVKKLAELIDNGGLPCNFTYDVEKDLWAKMLYNCSLNPLGAIFRVKYGELYENEELKRIIEEIVKEIFAIMEYKGYKTYWEKAEEYIEFLYRKLIPSTYEHRSSMLQDIEAGRKTEIDYLNGMLLKLIKGSEIGIPVNETIVRMIKFIEKTDK